MIIYIETEIDNSKNSKCWFCGERVNHTISECGKLQQKEYKT